jgi:hypothetical protein
MMANSEDPRHSNLEVVYQHDMGKQVVPADGKNHIGASDLEVAPEQIFGKLGDDDQLPISVPAQKRLSTRWIIGGGAIALVILAAVLGGVLGSRIHKSATASSSSTASNSTGNTTTSSFSPSTQHNIAAVSMFEKNENQTRVYFQDGTGQIVEASHNAPGTNWTTKGLGIKAKNGSVIAAGVTPPGSSLVCSPSASFQILSYLHKFRESA